MKKVAVGLMGWVLGLTMVTAVIALAQPPPPPALRTTPVPVSPTTPAGSAAAGKTGAPAVPTAPGKPAVTTELDVLVARINAKIKAGQKTPEVLAENLRAFDELLAKYKGKDQPVEAVAQVLYIKAVLYVQVLRDFNEGARILRQLKQEFPTSPQSLQVDDMLAQLKLPAEVQTIQKGLKPGAIFPDFSVKDMNGAPLSLAKFKGRPVLIVFWSTATTPFVQELPGLLAIYEKYHTKGFEIIGVAMEEHEFTLRSFLKGSGTPWPQYFDGQRWENQLAQKYGVITLPVSYLLDGSDRIMGVNLPLPALEASLAGMVKK